MIDYDAIVIGGSAGGLNALSIILSCLPKNFPLPIIVVQHVMEGSDSFLAEYLNGKVMIQVKEANDKEPIVDGCVYIAPAGYHLLIEEDKTLSLSVDHRVNYSRPSIDVLFESAAYVYEKRCIGIVLTGANADGSEGLKKIKKNGGLAIVQDPLTAEYNMMPNAAIHAVKVDIILSLEEIGNFLSNLKR